MKITLAIAAAAVSMLVLNDRVALGVDSQSVSRQWLDVERQCYAEYQQRWLDEHGVPCASCSAGWKDVTRCTARKVMPQVSPQVVEWCIETIEQQHRGAPMSTDRVSFAMSLCSSAR